MGEQLLTFSVPKPGFIRTPGDKWDIPRFVRKDAAVNRQIEIVESALVKYGLSESEVKTYLHLVMAGEKKASEIAEAVLPESSTPASRVHVVPHRSHNILVDLCRFVNIFCDTFQR